MIKSRLLLLLVLLFSALTLWSFFNKPKASLHPLWEVRSIDTVKYSRDLSLEKLSDEGFELLIDSQVKNIAEVGTSHVAIGTPYDEQFLPYLKKWVDAARKYGLNVWFRGNFSGWERWFGYPRIDRQTHTKKTEEFILKNPDLFVDGDIFTPCPECENGGPGDPRQNGDVLGHRAFLTYEYQVTKDAFIKIDKKVTPGYYSMNLDVAKLLMDDATTKNLGGIVVVDHYVSSADQLAKDIDAISKKSGGQIVLGEFGAPIPDIHGKMTEDEQADWIRKALSLLSNKPEVIGINYWVGVGGSTQLWEENGKARKALEVIRYFYTKRTP